MTTLLKKLIAGSTAAAFLFTVIAAPHAEAGFWEERQRSAGRAKPEQMAQLPSSGADQAVPSAFDGKGLLARVDKGLDAASADPRTRSLPSWLSSLPTAFGEIREVRLASDPRKSPLIVHIQDVHGYADAQHNISEMIRRMSASGGLSLVGVEGAAGGFTMAPYRAVSDKAALADVSDFLLDRGLIAGPEHAAWTADKEPALWGVETRVLYQANVQAHRDAKPFTEALSSEIKGWDGLLEALKAKVYDAPLLAFDKQQALYHKGQLGLGEYINTLYAAAAPAAGRHPNLDLFHQAVAMESAMDFSGAEKDRTRLIEALAHRLSKDDLASLVQSSILYRAGGLSYGRYYAIPRTSAAATASSWPGSRRWRPTSTMSS
jgi:hypothetical protein